MCIRDRLNTSCSSTLFEVVETDGQFLFYSVVQGDLTVVHLLSKYKGISFNIVIKLEFHPNSKIVQTYYLQLTLSNKLEYFALVI